MARKGIADLPGPGDRRRPDRTQTPPPPPPPQRTPLPPVPAPAPPAPTIAPAAAARTDIRRVTVHLPAAVVDRLTAATEELATTYGAYVSRALERHGDQLPPEGTFIPGGRGRRRRVPDGRHVPLYLSAAERAAIDAALEQGRASSISDLITRLVDLALPAPQQR